MPVETIKCQECGSADVNEFKAGSFVCQHCEATFKHIHSGGAQVTCAIDGCGVSAIGRCRQCGRGFCATHQARDYIYYSGNPHVARSFTDWCSSCMSHEGWLAQEREKAEKQRLADAQSREIAANIAATTQLDPIEAWLLVALTYVYEESHMGYMGRGSFGERPGFRACTNMLCGEQPSNSLFARWLISHFKTPPTPNGVPTYRRNLFFYGYKRISHDGWRFYSNAFDSRAERYRPIYVTTEGLCVPDVPEGCPPFADLFSLLGLREIAEACGLTPLGPDHPHRTALQPSTPSVAVANDPSSQ
jgi:hypothetical protein